MSLLHYQKLVNSLLDICSQTQIVPNVTANTKYFRVVNLPSTQYGLYVNNQINYTEYQGTTTVRPYYGQLNLDLSRSNNIYTNQNLVRPHSRTCKFFIRYI